MSFAGDLLQESGIKACAFYIPNILDMGPSGQAQKGKKTGDLPGVRPGGDLDHFRTRSTGKDLVWRCAHPSWAGRSLPRESSVPKMSLGLNLKWSGMSLTCWQGAGWWAQS